MRLSCCKCPDMNYRMLLQSNNALKLASGPVIPICHLTMRRGRVAVPFKNEYYLNSMVINLKLTECDISHTLTP